MRKCEIAVGVVDLLIVAFAVLQFHATNATAGIGISGEAGSPTAIHLYSSISYDVIFVLANGLLLLISPRWKAIVILPALLVFLHVLNI